MAAVTLRLIALLFLVSLYAADVSAKKSKQLTAVEDMRYGVALYHYYQGDYMLALTELLIAKQRGGIQGHGDNPEIMEGGFSLGFGLERHASAIFERLLEQNRSRRSQDAAWFFLSKLRYLREDWQGAEEAISRVRTKPHLDIRSEVYAHRINLAIQQGDLQSATKLLRKRTPAEDWLPYIHYNLGAAYARQGEIKEAIQYFEKLSIEQFPTDELRVLYDKAMTSAGYAYILDKQYKKAITQFSRVRLTSAHSNRALLGYGWAAAELGEFKEALKPWEYLAKSSLIDENSQEALIAVPYAYEKLGREGLALEYFQLAEANFIDELTRLEGVISGMSGNQLLEAFKIERSSGMDWLKHVRENQVSPQLGYLAQLFSREEFQGLVQELRDLVGIREDLIEWQEKLEFYLELTVTREQGRNKKAEELAARELSDSIAQMQEHRTTLARRIENIAANKDYFALANEDEKDLIERVQRSQKSIAALKASDPYIEENEEAIRRYYGVLYWDASEKFSDRLWRVVKTLNLLDKTLATLTRNHEKVEYLIGSADDLVPMKNRMAELSDRLEVMVALVDLVVEKTQDDLRSQTSKILETQRTRLNHYIAQSRLSQARLYDKALKASMEAAYSATPENAEQARPADASDASSPASIEPEQAQEPVDAEQQQVQPQESQIQPSQPQPPAQQQETSAEQAPASADQEALQAEPEEAAP